MAQTFSVKLTVTSGAAYITVTGEDGTVMLSDATRATNFSDTLPLSQDYLINVVNSGQTATSYSLTLTIK